MINETKKLEERIKFLEDRVVFHYGRLTRPYKEPDDYGYFEVKYDKIPNLPLEPEINRDYQGDDAYRIEIFVPNAGKTIIFIFKEYIESFGQPKSQSLDGPYLAREPEPKKSLLRFIYDKLLGRENRD